MSQNNGGRSISDPTRRALLGTLGAGASGLVAGCSGGGGGDGDGTPTQGGTQTGTGDGTAGQQTATAEDLAHVSGQTLNYFMAQNPEDVTWFGTGVFPGPQGPYAPSIRAVPKTLTMQNSIRGPWLNKGTIKTGEFHGETYESVDISAGEITVKIRDDANWSNGDPVTSGDALAMHLIFRLFFGEPHWDDVSDSPPIFNRAVTDYEVVSDKEFKLLSKHELWTEQFTEPQIWGEMCWGPYWGGIFQNVDQEPYDEWWSAIQDWWSQAKNGEIDPWEGDFNVWNESKELMFGDHGWGQSAEDNNYDYHWEKYFQKPENVHTTGAWTLDQINGSKNITLKPNEHHYAADKVNFDQIKVHYRSSGRANRAALNANSQDYYRGNVPSHIANSFPDDVEQRLVPSNGGLAVAFNHRHRLFENPHARQAIQHAIDTERVARSVHQDKFDPVTVPGGHGYRTTEVVGQDWIDQNLQSYERDLDTAASLMQEAGFSREGGQWVDGEGNPLSIELATSNQTPTMEPTFASQLKQFGIEASIQTYSGGPFEEKRNAGELNMWPTTRGVGYASNVGFLYYLLAAQTVWARNWYRVWPDELIDEMTNEAGDTYEGPNRPERWEPMTVEAPPIGQPDGELQEYEAVSTSMRINFTSSEEQFREDLKEIAWVINWHMPVFPIANGQSQHFMDTAHWNWPAEDSSEWDGVGVAQYQPENLLAYGSYFQANPENPEDGASVEE